MPDPFNNFYTTYNRTEAQERVRDLLVVCSAARGLGSPSTVPFRVILAGLHRAGLWTLLAAPGADAVIADSDALDAADESSLLAADIFCPGLLAMGGFEGVVMLAAPHPLLLHNTGARFSTDSLRRTYDASGVLGQLRIKTGHLTDTEIAESAAQF